MKNAVRRIIAPAICIAVLLFSIGCTALPVFKIDFVQTRIDSSNFPTAFQGSQITFRALIENAQSYEWDFGDGSTGSGRVVSHLYSTEGIFTVTLVVEKFGRRVTASKEIRIIFTLGYTLEVTSFNDLNALGANITDSTGMLFDCDIVSNGGSGVMLSGDCTETVPAGTEVVLIASPTANNGATIFDFWEFCDTTNGNICTVIVNNDFFVRVNYTN